MFTTQASDSPGSGLKRVRIDFRDRTIPRVTTQKRASFGHAFRRGTFFVRISATDRAGNAVVERVKLVIKKPKKKKKKSKSKSKSQEGCDQARRRAAAPRPPRGPACALAYDRAMSAELQQLGPAGAASDAAAFVERLGLWGHPGRGDRPRVVVAMVGSADGRATVDGSAGGLGSPADRSVLRELRTAADALLVGPGTLIAERYATLLDPPQRERRVARGLPEEPLLATISRSLDGRLGEVPVLSEVGQRVAVYTESGGEAPSGGALVTTHHFAPGTLTPRACLEDLRSRAGVGVVVSEGGPSLLHGLLADGLVDDLVLTLAPALVAGDGRSVVAGPVLDPPVELELRDVLRGEDHLFLHYAPAVPRS